MDSDKKITEFEELMAVAKEDVLAIADVSAAITYKISIAKLLTLTSNFFTVGTDGVSNIYNADGVADDATILQALEDLDTAGGGTLLIRNQGQTYNFDASVTLTPINPIKIIIEDGVLIRPTDDSVLIGVHTKVGSTSSSTYNPIFNIIDPDNGFHVEMGGVIDVRSDIYTKPVAFMVRRGKAVSFEFTSMNCTVDYQAEALEDYNWICDFIFAVDVEGLLVRNMKANANLASMVACEGIVTGLIENTTGKGMYEVIDSNAYNRGLIINGVYGTNIESQVVDMNAPAYCTTMNVYGFGDTPQLIFLRNYPAGEYTGALTAKTEDDFINCDHISLINIQGSVTGRAIDIDVRGGTMHYLTLDQIDVISSGESSQVRSSVTNGLDYAKIKGTFKITGIDSEALTIGEKRSEGMYIDVVVSSTNGTSNCKGVILTGIQKSYAKILAKDCEGVGAYIRSNDSARGNTKLDLDVSAYNNGVGLHIDAVGSGVSANMIHAKVNCHDNDTDIKVTKSGGATLTYIDIDGSYETENVDYQDTVFVNGVSYSTSVPSSTPKHRGLISVNTSTGKVYISTGVASSADWKLMNVTIDTDVTLAANSDSVVASQKATKAYVDGIVAANDAMVFKGVIDASSNPNYPAADRGHTYKISVAGKIGGASGTNVEVNDIIICLTDGTSAGTQAGVGASWAVIQANIDGAVVGPSSATDNDIVRFDGTTGKLIKAGIALDTDTALTANSDVKLATQKAVKAYVDAVTAVVNGKLTATLASAKIFVGNGSNVATAVDLSGDATLTNAGVMALITQRKVWVDSTAPSSPVTGMLWFDTTDSMLWVYDSTLDGGSWVSSQRFRGAKVSVNGGSTNAATFETVKAANSVDYDVLVISIVGTIRIAATNDGSNYWGITLSWRNTTNTDTPITAGSFNTSADTVNQWTKHSAAIAAVDGFFDVSATAVFAFLMLTNKVGSPGNFFIDAGFNYRLVKPK